MVGFIEILLFNFDLHHHFDRGGYIFFMVVAFERLLETEQSFNYFVLLVVDESFVVVRSGRLIALDLAAIIQIFQSQLQFALLIVHYPSFFDTDVAHISFGTSRKGLDCFFKVFEFFFAGPLANVSETFGAVEFDGFSEIFKGMVVVFLFEVQLPSIDEAVIVIFVEFQSFVELNAHKVTISMASSYFCSRL